ncbi:MAG: plasmid mobilization relaxosome protein MobC [Cyanobacteria bacterium P01_A01_bin.40]
MTEPKRNSCLKKESKVARIDLRATPREKAELQLKAQASGMSLGKYLITAGLNKKLTRITSAIDKALYLELCRQGNNLNQLARLHNTQAASGKDTTRLHPEDLEMLEKIYALIRQILDRLQGRKVS